MLSRILLGVVSAVAGGIFVSAASAAGPDDDPDADAACSFLPELTVAPPTDYPDVRLLNGYSNQAAFDPARPRRLVVGISWRGCYVKRSADGGRTWGPQVRLPQLAGAECSYPPPAVTYAAEGRLYAAYVYRRQDNGVKGVALSASTDHGATWSAPTKTPLGERDVNMDDVRLIAAPEGPWLYVATIMEEVDHGEQQLLFSSSGDQGGSWTGAKTIAYGSFQRYPNFLSGFGLAAGRGGKVLVAYGLNEARRFGAYSSTVQVSRSADHGASFLYGTADQSDSSTLSDPDIEIGPFGTAHLVYATGQNPGAAILYKYSFPPYGTWSAEHVRLDDDVPQAYVGVPRLALGACGKASVLHVTWGESLDGDYGPEQILYTRKVAQPGYPWSEPLKVGHLDRIYENGLAAAGPKAFSIFSGWTAAGPQESIAGSRISSGVTCP